MELKKYKLGDVADIVNGATPSTHNSENYDGSIIWITPKDLSDQKQKIIRRGQRNISEIGFNNCSAQMIPPYNILMSSRAPIGLLAINENECCTNQGFKNLVLDKSICDTDYMYYYLQFHMKEIEALGSGTTFKEISKSALQGLEIRLPNLEKQRDIAKCLSDLDRKIELNKQINDNLEAMAKQLYDYWFVQFDFPNEEGKPYKSSGGAMVWNEKLKREIPQGWSGVSLKDLALTSRNAITPVENEVYQHFSIPSFDACGSYSLDNGSDIKSDKFVLQKGQLLVSKLNPWFNRVVWVPKGTNMIGSTEFVVLNPNNESESGYIYSVIKSPKFIAYCSQAATGTSHSQRRVSPDVLMAFKVVYEQGVVQKYGCLIEKIQKQQAELLSEIAILTKQRDELLPLLMNGQASVNYHLS